MKYCESISRSTKPNIMELSFVISIFSTFAIFEAVLTIAKLSQTTRKQRELQREPNEVSNESINPCTCGIFLCEYIKILTKKESQKFFKCYSKHAIFVGEVVTARYDGNDHVDGSQLFSHNRIDFLKMFCVYFRLIRKCIIYGYQRDKSSKYGMCLMTHTVTHHGARRTQTVTHSTQLVHSPAQHGDIINNGNNINTIGDINGITSQTVGNTSISNTPQLASISGITGINNDVAEFDVDSADDGGESTRFKPNVDYKHRNKQNTQPGRLIHCQGTSIKYKII